MSPLLELALILLAIGAIVFSTLTVFHKSLIYSSVFLALLGLANAAIFAMLGYYLVAFVQIVIYVGAAVLFIVISVSMFREPLMTFRSWSFLCVVAAFAVLLVAAVALASSAFPGYITTVPVQQVVKLIIDNGFAVVILMFALSIGLVAAVAISRGGEQE